MKAEDNSGAQNNLSVPDGSSDDKSYKIEDDNFGSQNSVKKRYVGKPPK